MLTVEPAWRFLVDPHSQDKTGEIGWPAPW
jgi:hypothetical protein